ncbi:MAG: hypothetical protein KBG28_12435 [Kofleriaceae bacterium]|jgi:hypothetical protein|nr:hypothetical protein [Kofleriaceae bacterium]MBP6840236.1 hypothetical protein [Kofleriaceae bacterium]MBP9204768.1 hypothetical protein [Kofleriaceae bacterium]
MSSAHAYKLPPALRRSAPSRGPASPAGERATADGDASPTGADPATPLWDLIEDPAHLDELADLAEQMRAALGRERQAIAALDPDLMRLVDDDKRRVIAGLESLTERAGRTRVAHPASPERRHQVATLVRLVRAEGQANGLLIAAAREAIAAALGEVEDGYDKHAKRTAQTRPLRIIATI